MIHTCAATLNYMRQRTNKYEIKLVLSHAACIAVPSCCTTDELVQEQWILVQTQSIESILAVEQ
jgi:hypothetical protein